MSTRSPLPASQPDETAAAVQARATAAHARGVVDLRADEPHTVLRQHAALVQIESEV